MRIQPMLPIWAMAIICILMLCMKRKGFFPFLRQLALVALLFVINLRISIPSNDISSSSMKLDMSVLFVVDNTISMQAMDYNGKESRFSGVIEDTGYIIDTLYGADFSVISFDNTAKLLCPSTNDTEFAKNTITSISPMDKLYAKGSSMNVCKELLLDVLKRLEKRDKPVVVFFISDGEITNEDTLSSFSDAASYIDYGAVLGYGTKQGGKMYVTEFGSDEKTILQDETEYPYTDAISKLDETNLKQLAKDMKLSYINMTSQELITDTLENIQKNVSASMDETEETSGYQEIYYWFLIPVMALLFYEFRVINNEKR